MPTPIILRRTSRISHSADRYDFSTTLANTTVPTSYSQASKHVCWVKAMQEELQALQENYTWELFPILSILSSLVINKYILLSYGPMAHLTDIK